MNKLLPVAAAFFGVALLFVITADNIQAHGGFYRGPGGQVPPSGRTPNDPTPPPTPGSGTTPGGGSVGGGTTPGSTGAAPGPAGLPVGPRPAGSTGGAAVAGRQGGSTPGGRRKTAGVEGFERWEFWWAYNREPFLELKSKINQAGASTDSLEYLVGKADRDNIQDTTRPTSTVVRETVVPALIEALRDGFFDVRAAAVIALGKVGEKSEIPALMKMLGDDNKQVRESTCLALGMLGDPGPIPQLVSIMNNTVEGKRLLGRTEILDRTRAFAAIALGLIGMNDGEGSEAVVEPLLKALDRREAAQDVPICALTALGLAKAESAVPRILDLARNPSTEELLRAHAVIALGKIGDRQVMPAIQALTRDKDLQVRRSAIIALGKLSGSEDLQSIALLNAEVERGREPQSKNWALISLGQIGGEEARKTLLRALAGEQKSTQAFAALALAILSRNNGSAADNAGFVHDVFKDTKGDSARAGMAIALGLMKHKEAKDDLVALMSGKGDPDLRGYCAVALGLMEARDTIPAIKRVLGSRVDPDFQRSAATALGLMGDKDIVGLLTDILTTARTEYEISASALALGFIGDVSAVAPLVAAVKNKDGLVDLARANATTALGIVGEDRPLPVLHVVAIDNNYRALVDSLNELLSIN
jgi:HEAT repeat protein